MATVALTQRQQVALADAANGAEWYVRDPVASAVVQRRAAYETLVRALGGAAPAIIGPELIAQHARCVGPENELAGVLRGLSAGQLQIVPWWDDERAAARGDVSSAHLAVARPAGGAALGLWPLAAIAVVGAVVVVVGGLWVLADLYLTAEKVAAEADKTRADTAKKITDTVTALSATDPQAAAQLAQALAAANQAAQGAQPSWFERFGTSVGGGAGFAAVLALAYMFSRRGRLKWGSA